MVGVCWFPDGRVWFYVNLIYSIRLAAESISKHLVQKIICVAESQFVERIFESCAPSLASGNDWYGWAMTAVFGQQ
jgi:hypothetical protein